MSKFAVRRADHKKGIALLSCELRDLTQPLAAPFQDSGGHIIVGEPKRVHETSARTSVSRVTYVANIVSMLKEETKKQVYRSACHKALKK